MRKRILVLFISLMMVFGVIGAAPVNITADAYTSRTRDEALSWVRSMVGTGIDYDGVYGNQCVDLIKAYYNYLGVSPATGNGCDYATNTLPDGWQRIYQATPQPGDILVYTDGYGHVAIYEADRVHYHQNFNDSNYPNYSVVQCVGYMYNGLSNPYWGVIRPDFNTHTCSYTSTVTKNPTCTETGVRTYTCSCGSSYTEDIAATGHSYTSVVTPVTSTSKGYTTHTCSDCSYSYTDSYIDAPVLGDDGWYYCDALPSDISSDEYTIQYNNTSERISETSPGNDWTNEGIASTEWRNSGEQYTSETALETSDARVLVKECYYHWCIPGAGMTTEGNYEWTSYFSHYDEIVLPNDYVHVTSTGDDNGHTYYLLAWTDGSQVYCKSGEQCDGTQETHGYRCRAWYKHYVYQDRVQVTTYRFTKESGWVSEIDSTADSTACRYRLKGIDWNTKGDINQNSAITLSDTVLLQKYLLNLEPLTSSQMEIADINSDGRVNVLDICLLKAHLT